MTTDIKVILNKRDIRKRICPIAEKGAFQVMHDMPGEAIICHVPTLELAGVIVQALRQRAYVKAAEKLLERHRQSDTAEAKRALRKRVRKYNVAHKRR